MNVQQLLCVRCGSTVVCSVTVVSVTSTSGSPSLVDLAAVTSRALSDSSAV